MTGEPRFDKRQQPSYGRAFLAKLQAEEEDCRIRFDHTGVLCPECGGNNLHHLRIEAFFRAREEGPSLRISVERGGPSLDVSAPNPSERRDGLLIFFLCENCNLEARDRPLAVFQHKGVTFIEWRRLRPQVDPK